MRQTIPGRVRRYFTANAEDERQLHLEEGPQDWRADQRKQAEALAEMEEEENDV